MKHFIVGIIFLIVVCGAAAAASVYFHFGPLPHLLKLDQPKAPPPPPPPPKPSIIDVGNFSVPIIRSHEIGLQVGIGISIDVAPEALALLNKDLARLKNAYTIELYDFIPSHPGLARSEADQKAAHDRLLKIAIKLYGADAIHDVIIKGTYER